MDIYDQEMTFKPTNMGDFKIPKGQSLTTPEVRESTIQTLTSVLALITMKDVVREGIEAGIPLPEIMKVMDKVSESLSYVDLSEIYNSVEKEFTPGTPEFLTNMTHKAKKELRRRFTVTEESAGCSCPKIGVRVH